VFGADFWRFALSDTHLRREFATHDLAFAVLGAQERSTGEQCKNTVTSARYPAAIRTLPWPAPKEG